MKDCEGLVSARAVWDFMTGDARRFLDRVRLMLLAMQRFREQAIATEFVVLLHGGSTKFAARDFAGTKFAGDDAANLEEIHAALAEFTTQGGRVRTTNQLIGLMKPSQPSVGTLSPRNEQSQVFAHDSRSSR